jgi:hypothetical protein
MPWWAYRAIRHKAGYISHKAGYISHKAGYISHKAGYISHNYNYYLKYNKHTVVIFVIMFDPSLLDLANFLRPLNRGHKQHFGYETGVSYPNNFLPNDATEVIIVGETVVAEYMAYAKEMWNNIYTKEMLTNGNYWLGGQVKLSLTEKITDLLMDKVRKINAESGDYACNSWEMASIQRSQRQFSEIIVVVKRYREVMRRRVMAELEKTPLNADVNGVIMSLCG